MGFPEIFLGLAWEIYNFYNVFNKSNGSLEEYYEGRSGLRQGDPIPPYLFVLAMGVFSYHWKLAATKTNSLFFADDVILFSKSDHTSISRLIDGVTQFAGIYGLQPNPAKSCCYFSKVSLQTIRSILRRTGFAWGELPVTYLDLRLISWALNKSACRVLISRLNLKLLHWTAIFLSFAVRLQLIKTVLFGIFNYRASHIFLPNSILNDVQSTCAKFLWGWVNLAPCRHKVEWRCVVFQNLRVGWGLGVLNNGTQQLHCSNYGKLFSPIPTQSVSNWFKVNFLHYKSIWAIKNSKSFSWSVKRILQTRSLARGYVKFHIGYNSNTLF